MIYIFTLLVCIYCLVYYDVLNNDHNRKAAYTGLLIWFIAISALQYKMGSDMVHYMDWYDRLNINSLSISDLIDNNQRYQPGWMALAYLCRFISEDFLLLKIVQATFVNIAIFSFFKRETKYVFVSIFLYALMSYLVINFNILRQSIALGFALYGFTYLRLKDYKKYYLFILLSYLFHNSAIILIPLPLIFLFINSKKRYSRKSIRITILSFVAVLFVLPFLNLENILYDFLFSGYLGEHNSSAGLAYMSRDRLGVQSSFAVFSIQRLIMIVAVIYYMRKYNDPFYGVLGFIYILFQILTSFLPILWRFRLFFDFPFYILLSQLIVKLPQINKKISSVILTVIIAIVIYFPVREYLAHIGDSKYKNIDQYYPYYSIFDKEHDWAKQYFFETLTR